MTKKILGKRLSIKDIGAPREIVLRWYFWPRGKGFSDADVRTF